MSNWFEPLPIKEYRQLNEKHGQNPPEELPIDEPVGGLDIRCGPILRLAGTLEKAANYRATILLAVANSSELPTLDYKIGPSAQTEEFNSSSLSGGSFPGTLFYTQDDISFYRYHVDLELTKVEQKVRYEINGAYKPSFQFFVPAVDQSMNVVSFSCNGFSFATAPSDFKSSLWYDVINRHSSNHYHVMLGGGDQIYADSVKVASEELKKWAEEENYHKKLVMKASPELKSQLTDFYLNHYLAWFGKGFWKGKNGTTLQSLFPIAMSQIPSVNIYDDHDIIDGFGSYHDTTMSSEVFSAIGNTAYKYYMIFQHHMSPDEELHENDPSWILSKQKGPFIHEKNHSNYLRLGKEIAFVGFDCRTERKLKQVVHPDTYKIIFERLKNEIASSNGDIKHLLVMLGVPIFYPRLVWLEWILTSTILKPIRKLATKGVIAKGLVNEFDGDVEVLDDLNDHWTSKHHKRERNKLVRDLLEFGSANGVRVTILSGDVHLAALGRIKSKYHKHPVIHHLIKGADLEDLNVNVTDEPENDPRLIFNVISSAIVNGPPPNAMATLLNKRTKIHHFDHETDEDVVPIFTSEVNGHSRDNHRFLNKRNWCDLILGRQSRYASSISETATIKDVERKFPQPVAPSGSSHIDRSTDSVHVKYPLYADSLVTTYHVEKDPNDFDAATADYEVVIPKLFGKFKLERSKVKHLN